MDAATYLIKAATTRWKGLFRKGLLSSPSTTPLISSGLLNPEYLSSQVRGLKRAPTWSEILGRAGGHHSSVIENYAEAAKKFPRNLRPVNIIGTGGESLAIKMRDGNVMKMTISPKAVQTPRQFDAPLVNRGGVTVTNDHVPVQWHVQPKLDIMRHPDMPSTFKHVQTSDWLKDTVLSEKFNRFQNFNFAPHGDEIAAQRFIRQHTRGGLKPTDVYPQVSGGYPDLAGKPKVQQFGRTRDGRMVLADRGAISEHASVPDAANAGAFNGPQMLSEAIQTAKSTGLKPGTSYTAQELDR